MIHNSDKRCSTVLSDQFYSPPAIGDFASLHNKEDDEDLSDIAEEQQDSHEREHQGDEEDEEEDMDKEEEEEDDEVAERRKLLITDFVDFPLRVFIDYERQKLAILSDLLASFVPSYMVDEEDLSCPSDELRTGSVARLYDLFLSLVGHNLTEDGDIIKSPFVPPLESKENIAPNISDGPPKKRRRSELPTPAENIKIQSSELENSQVTTAERLPIIRITEDEEQTKQKEEIDYHQNSLNLTKSDFNDNENSATTFSISSSPLEPSRASILETATGRAATTSSTFPPIFSN